jgi:hypothetical protein
LPVRPRLGHRLIGAGFIQPPDRQLSAGALGVGPLDQPFFAAVSRSTTVTGPRVRRRREMPVWHHERSRCQLTPASWSTHQMV